MAIEVEISENIVTNATLHTVNGAFGIDHETTDEEFAAAARKRGYSIDGECASLLAPHAEKGDLDYIGTLKRIIRERDEAVAKSAPFTWRRDQQQVINDQGAVIFNLNDQLAAIHRVHDDLVAKLKDTEAQLREERENIFGVSRFVKVVRGFNESHTSTTVIRCISLLASAIEHKRESSMRHAIESAATILLNWLWAMHPENPVNSVEVNKAKEGLCL